MYTFNEYMDMPEYHNIQTRMLGADSFPYRNITVTDAIYAKAIDALDHMFYVGIHEEYAISAEAMLREFHVHMTYTIAKERDNSNRETLEKKEEITKNVTIMQRLEEINHYDMRLYEYMTQKWCTVLTRHPDLLVRVRKNGKVNC